jgi:kynureninase
MITLEYCRELDAGDPLASLREGFVLSPDVIYLDGNSLGPPLLGVHDRVLSTIEGWGQDLIAGWWNRDWVGLPHKVGRRLEPLIGAEPGSVVCADSTTVNLFKVVDASCRLAKGDVLTDSGNFPTDLYVLRSLADRWRRSLRVVEPEELAAAITDGVGVVAAGHVDFRTGRSHDLPLITARAHQVGALAVWDLSHSAGVMPIGLADNGVDYAVGCGYKYLNGGPGAPAFVYVSPRLQADTVNPITGWFGHSNPFDFSPEFVPAAGVDRMKVGTPNILSMVVLDAALAVWEGVDLEVVRAKSVGLTSLFIDLVDQELGERLEVVTPRYPEQRGSQVSLRRIGAEAVVEGLGRHGVICDYRPPDIARFGFAPLYLRFEDVWKAVSRIKEVN